MTEASSYLKDLMCVNSDGGVELKKSSLADGGLGAFATRDLKTGDVLFKVPRSIMLSAAIARDSMEELEAVAKKRTDITSETLLFAYMVLTLDSNEYLQSLTSKSPRCDLLKTELAGTNVGAQLSRDEEELAEQWRLLKEHMVVNPTDDCTSSSKRKFVPDLDKLTLASMSWARGHYNSRRYPLQFSQTQAKGFETDAAVGVRSMLKTKTKKREREDEQEGEKRRLYDPTQGSLVPLLDILNHKSGSKEWLDFDLTTDLTALLVRTRIPYMIGDEIFSNYGCSSNDQFLLQFGFCDMLDSKYNCFTVKTGGKTFDLRPGSIPEELIMDGGEGLYHFLEQKQQGLSAQGAMDSQHAPTQYYLTKQREVVDALITELEAGMEEEEEEGASESRLSRR